MVIALRLLYCEGCRTWRDGVQSYGGLVGVFQQHVFAVLFVQYQFANHLDDTPHVVHAEIDLGGEVLGFEELGGEDDVFVRVAGGHTRHITKLHLVRTWGNEMREIATSGFNLIRVTSGIC